MESILLVSTMLCVFVSACIFASFSTGGAYDHPRLGAAGIVANDYVPEALPEAEGEEGEADHEYYPHEQGVDVGTVFTKALECFDDRHIYSSCDEKYRLTQHGEVNVPHEYVDQYCNGACLEETELVLECIDEIFKHFVFYNKATINDVRETIKTGCSHGPERGHFNVEEHIEADDAITIAFKMSTTIFFALEVMIIGWHVLI
ncbi:hypothetical protein ACS0TY_023023 [Phlomoides rotata]